MFKANAVSAMSDEDELKGFARTIAEIEWLLLVLVLVYLVAVRPEGDGETAIYAALFFLGAFILAFHYVNFYKQESQFKISLETVVMIVFITWVTTYSGGIDSPLLNLYLLPIIASSLILGKIATTIETVVIIACYMAMAYYSGTDQIDSSSYWGKILALISPVVLVAYITTMLSADIRHAVAKIKRVSDIDELTGIYNMRAFSAILQRIFQQSVRHGHPLSIIMVDSDDMKTINDTHGHEAGNRLLQYLTRKISEELRRSDIVARYGGDEFIVLLPETGLKGAIETAERIRKSIESSQFDVRGTNLQVTVSLGVANYPENGGNIDVIVDKADKALYRAKRKGRNRTTSYEIEEESDDAEAGSDLKYETLS